MLGESEVREVLHRVTLKRFHEDANTLVLDELGVCENSARVDVSVLNGSLIGFEIKSESDSLKRLSRQAFFYNQVFHRMSLVVDFQHLEEAKDIVPDWWGLIGVRNSPEGILLEQCQEGCQNPDQDPHAVAQLLWRWELLEELEHRGIDKGVRSKRRRAMCARLAKHLQLKEVCSLVLRRLKARSGWRSDQ